jgi:predicted double-glycine peptidase
MTGGFSPIWRWLRPSGQFALCLSAGLFLSEAFAQAVSLPSEMVVHQQWDFSCGAAALATVLKYQQGFEVSEAQVVRGMLQRTTMDEVTRRHGFSMLDLKRYAQDVGFEATGYGNLDIGDLSRLEPAIVPIRKGSGNHFVVFRGRRGHLVLLGDPASGTRVMQVTQFNRAWLHVALVVTGPGRQGASNRLTALPDDFVGVAAEAP